MNAKLCMQSLVVAIVLFFLATLFLEWRREKEIELVIEHLHTTFAGEPNAITLEDNQIELQCIDCLVRKSIRALGRPVANKMFQQMINDEEVILTGDQQCALRQVLLLCAIDGSCDLSKVVAKMMSSMQVAQCAHWPNVLKCISDNLSVLPRSVVVQFVYELCHILPDLNLANLNAAVEQFSPHLQIVATNIVHCWQTC